MAPKGHPYDCAMESSDTMTQGQVVAAAGVTRKALRGYEELGLVSPGRDHNGYRFYDTHQVRLVAEIRRLSDLGISLRDIRPFVDCLNSGSPHADSCPSTLAEYRHAIDRIDSTVRALSERRARLVANLTAASGRLSATVAKDNRVNPFSQLPADLPAPEDDGAADGLPGRSLPALALPSTDGNLVDVADLGPGRSLIYVFPMTGTPGRDLPEGWDHIPGARGCTTHNCDMRNHYAELMQAGISRVYGLSAQPVAYQQSLAATLHLPYPLLTDEHLRLATDPGLPTFTAGNLTLYRRLAMIVTDGIIEKVFYPIFPPNQHAVVVLDWLAEHPVRG